MPRVLIFGTGNVGTVYAMLLHKAGAEVICVCRSNYETAKSSGFTVYSTIFGDNTFFPTVVASIQEAVELDKALPFDFILDCTKALSNEDLSIAKELNSAVQTRHTSIVVIKNGLGVESPYYRTFSRNTIISAVTYLPTSQIRPGVVSHTETQQLHIGTYPASNEIQDSSKKTKIFAQLIRDGGGNATVHLDVQIERWRKLIGNATWNPICALSRCRDLQLLQSSDLASSFVERAMYEVVDVARALGYGELISKGAVTAQLQRSAARSWPGVEPSMLSDILHEKSMEVDAIIGEVVKLGKKHGLEIPRLESLYVLLKGLNWALKARKKSTAN